MFALRPTSQTKAYYYDAGLAYGRQSYLATGRNFVLRHVPLDEVFRSCSHSHLYLGMECLILLILTSAHGKWESVQVYVYLFVCSWIYVISLVWGAGWFNPAQLEWASAKQDWRSFTQWMLRQRGPAEHSWRTWYGNTTESQYQRVGWKLRMVRLIRVSRLLIPFFVILYRSAAVRRESGSYFPLLFALAGGSIVACQATWAVQEGVIWTHGNIVKLCQRGRRGRSDSEDDAEGHASAAAGAAAGGGGGHSHGAAPVGPPPDVSFKGVLFGSRDGLAIILRTVVIVGSILAAAWLYPAAQFTAYDVRLEAVIAFAFLHWWAARVVGILSLRPLTAGARAVNAAYDLAIGLAMLLVQAFFCVIMPCGRAVSPSAACI